MTAEDVSTIHILPDSSASAETQPYELVERKGVGHPDTMCDAIAERASRRYSEYCLKQFGRVAHHWFDKVMLFGGEADIDYGRGDLTKPYTVLYAGKGAYSFGDQPIPLRELLFDAAAEVLSEVTTGFDPARHLTVQCEIVDHQGAGRGHSRYRPQTLDDLIDIGDPRLVSNDCNLLHGYAPLSRLEQLVLGVEQHINGAEFKRTNPDTGWDVKVFGSRFGEHFKLIVNMPFLASQISSLEHYFTRKQQCENQIGIFSEQLLGIRPDLLVNPTDRNGRPYLTALGSVADTGDVGVVGRGNRINGLITPMRSMSIEAPAGKNPLDHTGKLYGVLARDLAAEIHNETGFSVETHVFTSKEAPLGAPDEVIIRLVGWEPDAEEEARVRAIVERSLANVSGITAQLVSTGVVMW
ncbi:methionine adenosyltransferase [Nocardia goodfellowii]|uniref:S-adenosylmethionine synthetase n=1 Tax=Nocardia goodfellowii TaxID=882446 RepID=A0ABS4QEW4_9NOCA|nr:methionine adenosyltransferase [Nocardia goodfellowii]MBP2189680.1 S-adenosylmethionine synthetase [Nocardia goodfellowii]